MNTTFDGILENVIWHEGNLDPNRQSQDLDLAGYRVSDIAGANFIDLDNDETTDGTSNNVVINSVQGIYNIIDANHATAPTGNGFGVWHGKTVEELTDNNALFHIDEDGDTLISGSLEAKEIIKNLSFFALKIKHKYQNFSMISLFSDPHYFL